MNCRALAFHQLPHQPKLFLAYLEKFEKVKAFYAYPPTMQAVTRASKKLDYPQERRAEVAAILSKQNETLGTGTETTSNLERLAKGAVAVVSGQQVGLFGGPAYAIYKALTAIQIADELTRDRKSTRLNSSHTVISYAVFCLKKKKKTKTQDIC